MTFYLQALFRQYSMSSWRKTDQGGDIKWNTDSEQNLMTECKNNPFSGQDDKVPILFVGFSGHGKTTSISSFLSVFYKGVTYGGGCYGVTDDESPLGKSTTKKEKEIPIKTSEGLAYFSFIDSEGMADDKDLCKQTENVKNLITGPGRGQEAHNFMACPKPCSLVFVMDASNLTKMSKKVKKRIGEILEHAEEKGLAVEILLTKCDLVDTRLQDPSNIPYIFFSPYIRECVKNASAFFSAVTQNRIHPIVNNTTDTTQIKEQKILHLLAMRCILANAKIALISRTPNLMV